MTRLFSRGHVVGDRSWSDRLGDGVGDTRAPRRDPELEGRRAASAIRAAARMETLLPLHVNVFAASPGPSDRSAALRDAVRKARRLPWEVTVGVGPLLEVVAVLRSAGFRICAAEVGDGDVPLSADGQRLRGTAGL